MRLRYLDYGGEGDALPFVPGPGGTAKAFNAVAPHFMDRYHVLAVTRRWHGASEKTDLTFDIKWSRHAYDSNRIARRRRDRHGPARRDVRPDVDGSVAIFTDDADWRTIERVMLRGRAEIRAALREWMGPPGDPPRATIRHPTGGTVVRMLNDDVAVADVAVEWHLSPPAGDGRPAAAENLFLVLVRTDGGWRIAHIRNTTNLPPPSSGERT